MRARSRWTNQVECGEANKELGSTGNARERHRPFPRLRQSSSARRGARSGRDQARRSRALPRIRPPSIQKSSEMDLACSPNTPMPASNLVIASRLRPLAERPRCSGGVPYLPRAADRTRSRRHPARCEHRYGPRADPNGPRRNTGLRQGIPPGLNHPHSGQPAKSHICLIVHAIDR
jgi:hypothetical protein